MTKQAVQRWLKFNIVGIAGLLVQLVTLTVLMAWFGSDIMPATFLAVEAAILHNFVWHENWTWADRARRGHVVSRFVQFNAANGAVSLAGNLLLMRVLVTSLRLNYIAANVAAIGACSIFNFLLSEFLVFAHAETFQLPKRERGLKPATTCMTEPSGSRSRGL
jgi:putative flippase GtrA